jgi:hypothetical protein
MARAEALSAYLKLGNLPPARQKVIANLMRAQKAIAQMRQRLRI